MEKRALIARWLGSDTQPIPIYDEASVSVARQRVRDAGLPLNLSKELVETVALIVSELAHNQLSHAKRGHIAVKVVERQGVKGFEVIAADVGPGIDRPILSASGGNWKGGGGLHAGLEGVFRLADEVDIDNRLVEGCAVIARKFETRVTSQCEIAIVGRPFPGEAISGDDALFLQSESELLAVVSDGLGHGPEARHASNRSIEAVDQNRHLSLSELPAVVNANMLDTRGCAMSIARFSRANRMIECILAGDIRMHLYNVRDAHFFTSTPVVVGHKEFSKRKVRVENITVEPGSVLVIFTDGLESRTTLKGQLEVLRQPAVVIAQHLISTHSRPNDDALVLVARFKN